MKKVLTVCSLVIILGIPALANAASKCAGLFKEDSPAVTFEQWIFENHYFPTQVQNKMNESSVIDSVKLKDNTAYIKIVDTESSNNGMGTINPRTVKVSVNTLIKSLEETLKDKDSYLRHDYDTVKDLLIFLLKNKSNKEPDNKVLTAIKEGSGIAMVFHIKYGEGYVTLDNKTGTLNFDQNSHEARPVDNVPYKDIALELPMKVESSEEIQDNMPFVYRGKRYYTMGQFADGSILAKSKQSNSLKKISLENVKRGVLALGKKNLKEGSKVKISPDFKKRTANATVMEVQGIYALVHYTQNVFDTFKPLPTLQNNTIDLIPLSLLK